MRVSTERNNMLRIGIIGMGGIAHYHAVEIQRYPNLFTIEAVADTNPQRLNYAKETFGVPTLYTDYQQMLQNPQIDAVLIASPHDLHELHCTESLQAGKHVLVEKPLSRTAEEGKRILAAADKAQKVLLIGHNERYMPQHAKIKQLILDNQLGKLLIARADHFQNFNPPPSSWWRQRERTGGGCVIGSGIHRLDLLLWFLGPVSEVYAHQTHCSARLEAEVACTASLRFKQGTIAEFLCNWGVYNYPYYESLFVTGTEGTVSFNQLTQNPQGSFRLQPDLHELVCPPVASLWEHFYACIAGSALPLSSGEEGLRAVALVQAIYASAETGKPVLL